MHANTQTGASLPRRKFSPNIVSLNLAKARTGRAAVFSSTPKQFTFGMIPNVATEAGKPRITNGRKSFDLSQTLTINPAK